MTARAGGPRIAVVGAGAVGGYLGGRLAGAGHEVEFLARGENLAALQKNGLRVMDDSGCWSVPDVSASDHPDDIGRVDFVLLCVKTGQLSDAVESLGLMVGPDTAVLTLQNGVDAPGQVAARIGRRRVLPGTIRIAATMAGPGEIRHAGTTCEVSFTAWDGQASRQVTRLRELFRESQVTVTEPDDIWATLWAKFLMVVPVGSLGAATGGATIGELRSRSGTRQLLIAGMREIYEAGLGLGIFLPDDAVDTAMGLVDRQSAGVTTSLQRDILTGRRSELDAWTGAAVRLAHDAGLSAPVHELLYELLAIRESRAAEAA
ncbi:2-dehydropantoate 2-reductase [Frankia sp. CcI156]|uniref:2-dehydropantoate 2-reductase n=1 Tax=unclassified Frankia TaxID=2632575 RepID=UPI00055927DE|nr:MULTISPECIES: 2-dehydropantoate 2-reductase [unclassified Frankia]OHV47854.1 2-dehydropantoate 2-reductase [Frankia sp. CgIS1]ONH22004.1 2-dehydropantoate 2-reductase [Frankia sp. CcI156]